MNIYLIRHTTPDIELIYCYGQSDIDVKDTFKEEVERIHTVFPEVENPVIYSSPLKRCKKLAHALNRGNVQFDNRLREINFGDWEMQPWKEIDKKALDFWIEDFVNRTAPGGESYQQLSERIFSFIEEIKEGNSQDVIVVSHGGAIRSVLATVLEMPLKNLFKIHIDFGGVSKLFTEKGKLKIGFINR